MARFRCDVCQVYEYDSVKGDSEQDIKPGTMPADFPDVWVCPICGSNRDHLQPIQEHHETEESEQFVTCPVCGVTSKVTVTHVHKDISEAGEYLGDWKRDSDRLEHQMADIHRMAASGRSVVEPMRTKRPTVSWGDILILGAQLARMPLNPDEPVNTKTVIGPKAKQPLVIETPIYITHMSFGALSREVKLALARGSAAVKTAMCSGEGGILPESLEAAHKYIFEYVPNEYSVTDDNLKKVDAVEIKIGQSAKPGMGGLLPASKVTPEIAELRGKPGGHDIHSPARFRDIGNRDELKAKVAWLRDKTGGKPVGIKLAAGHIEADLEVALFADPDFITIDGRPGATGASPKMVKDSSGLPTVYALARARKYFDERGVKDVSLCITGGLRVSADFAKALALGADAIAIGTAALMACGCQQYRLCDTGKCPVGVTTQDPELRARLKVDISARMLEDFLRVSTDELADFARLTGRDDVHSMSVEDLVTTSSEIAGHTAISHA